jgi:hypothetical protein
MESNHDRILRADDTLVLFGDLQPNDRARDHRRSGAADQVRRRARATREEAAFRRMNEDGIVLTSLVGAFGELAGALSDPQTQQAAAAVLGAYAP